MSFSDLKSREVSVCTLDRYWWCEQCIMQAVENTILFDQALKGMWKILLPGSHTHLKA